MKKMILTLVAMLSMTTAFAEGENAASVNNVEAYELNVNMNKLSSALNLADDQKEAVAEIHHTFASELMFAAQYSNNDRKALVDKVDSKFIIWGHSVRNASFLCLKFACLRFFCLLCTQKPFMSKKR